MGKRPKPTGLTDMRPMNMRLENMRLENSILNRMLMLIPGRNFAPSASPAAGTA